jgi:hypothetical protein
VEDFGKKLDEIADILPGLKGSANMAQKMSVYGELKRTVAEEIDQPLTTVIPQSQEKVIVGGLSTKAVQSPVLMEERADAASTCSGRSGG